MLLFAFWYVYHLAITHQKSSHRILHKTLQVNSTIFRSRISVFSLSRFTNSIAIFSPSTSIVWKNNYNYGLHLQLTMLENTLLFLCIKLPLCLLTTPTRRCCKGGNNFYRFLGVYDYKYFKRLPWSYACSFMSQPCIIYAMFVK